MVVRDGISEETLDQRPNEVRKAAMRKWRGSVPSIEKADVVLENSRNNRRQVWLESSEHKENSGRWKGGGTKKPDILRSVYNGKDFGLYSNVMINNRGKKSLFLWFGGKIVERQRERIRTVKNLL